MGVELQRVVDYVSRNTRGLAAVDLARLNLRVGQPLSRRAMLIPDRPDLVDLAWRSAREILDEAMHGASR
ncbi:MAG: hypothetical protein QM820_06725 [Minicystis sp.]